MSDYALKSDKNSHENNQKIVRLYKTNNCNFCEMRNLSCFECSMYNNI